MKRTFTAHINWDEESKSYIGYVPGIIGAHSQADSIDDLREKMAEVVTLCIEEMDEDDKQYLPDFKGITQIEVDV